MWNSYLAENVLLGLIAGTVCTVLFVAVYRFLGRVFRGNPVTRVILDVGVLFAVGGVLLAFTLFANAFETTGLNLAGRRAFILAAFAPALAARIVAGRRAR